MSRSITLLNIISLAVLPASNAMPCIGPVAQATEAVDWQERVDDPPSPHCQAELDAFCNSLTNCIQIIKRDNFSLPLYARYDRGQRTATKEWRCYSPSSLSHDHSIYTNGYA